MTIRHWKNQMFSFFSPQKKQPGALSLLTPQRFDIAAKLLYLKHYSRGKTSSFAKAAYLHHLEIFNSFFEKNTHSNEKQKKTKQHFVATFNSLIESLQIDGFDPKISKIWVNNQSQLLNGAHRVACAIYYDLPYQSENKANRFGQLDCSWDFFVSQAMKKKIDIDRNYFDAIALEYLYYKRDNLFLVCVFPQADDKTESATKYISEFAQIVYSKPITLNNNSANWLVSLFYLGEPWLGTWENKHQGAQAKVDFCFPNMEPFMCYLVEAESVKKMLELKKRLRSYFGKDKHSVHITDDSNDLLRSAHFVFNNNSIENVSRHEGLTYQLAKHFRNKRRLHEHNGKKVFQINKSQLTEITNVEEVSNPNLYMYLVNTKIKV